MVSMDEDVTQTCNMSSGQHEGRRVEDRYCSLLFSSLSLERKRKMGYASLFIFL
jgi:hypothetical protein